MALLNEETTLVYIDLYFHCVLTTTPDSPSPFFVALRTLQTADFIVEISNRDPVVAVEDACGESDQTPEDDGSIEVGHIEGGA